MKTLTQQFPLVLLAMLGTAFWAEGQADCGCDVIIPASSGFAKGSSYNYQPGDTICLMAGNKTALQLRDWHGTAEAPLTFINCGGTVNIGNTNFHYGLAMFDCTHFRLTGTGATSDDYGIRITGTGSGSGVSITGYSSDFEVDHIEVAGADFAGIMAKTDPDCNGNFVRDNFLMENINIHHNYIHHTGGEGLYIGSAFYTNGHTRTCSGVPLTFFPHDIHHLRIHHNRVEHTGWDGIQVGCATYDVAVHDNYVLNAGTEERSSHMNGIQMGDGTAGDCYNNTIIDPRGVGIIHFGLGDNVLYNNIIVRAGQNFGPGDPTKRGYGIFVDDRATLPGTSFHVINNTIVAPKTDGIRFYSDETVDNFIANNIIVAPGGYDIYENDNTSRTGQDAYVYLLGAVDVTIQNNLLDTSIAAAHFVDAANDDYRLDTLSPAINAGMAADIFGVYADALGTARPANDSFDIGAYELALPSQRRAALRAPVPLPAFQLELFPNPSSDVLHLRWAERQAAETQVLVSDLQGRVLWQEYVGQGEQQAQVAVADWPAGMYVLSLLQDGQVRSQAFRKQ